MSERTITTSDVNPNTTASAPNPACDQARQGQAAEEAAAREAELRAEAKATLDACTKAYAKGEAAYRAGLLEAARLADAYLHQRMALGDKRADAVGLIAMRWSEHSSTLVDQHAVNRAIQTYHAHRLLALEQGLCGEGRKQGPADAVPYGVYRDTWARLVERAAKDTPEESYVLLPGLEDRCRAAFAKAVKEGLGRTAVAESAAEIVRDYAKAQADAEAKRAEEAAARAKAEQDAATKAAAELKAAQEAQQAAAQEAKAKADEQTAAALVVAEEELRARQRAVIEAQARAEAAERERKAAEKSAREQAEAERRAADKAARKAAKREEQAGTPSTASPREQEGRAPKADGTAVTGNLLRVAEQGTVKDVAAMCVELVTGTGKPEAVLEEVLRQLRAGGHVSKRAVGAIDAALLVLTRKPESANRLNGQPTAAVA